MSGLAYHSPRHPEFKSRSFRASTLSWREAIRARIEAGDFRPPRRDWPWAMSVCPAPRYRPWGPKLYVCVGSRDYWRCVHALQRRFPGSSRHWKFFLGPTNFERPDKIVFYFDTVGEMRSAVPRVRKVIARMAARPLHNARSTAGLFEPPGARGLYVASDPNFLRTSWRFYRVLAVAWAAKNAAYLRSLPGGEARWYRRMNLSRRHEGPAALRPTAKDLTYVRRYWRLIDPQAVSGKA